MIETLEALTAAGDAPVVLAYSADEGRTWTTEEPRPARDVITRIQAIAEVRDGRPFLWMARLDSDPAFTRRDTALASMQVPAPAPAGTVTSRVVAAAKQRKAQLIEANTGPGEWPDHRMQARYLMVAESASVWAETPRRIIADVPDCRSAEIHGSGIVSYLLDIDVSEYGAPVAWRDRATITQLSPTRAVLTF